MHDGCHGGTAIGNMNKNTAKMGEIEPNITEY